MSNNNDSYIKDNVWEVYEKISDWMDQHRSRKLFEKPYLDNAITYLRPGAKVLDLGCGTGEPIGEYFVEQGYEVIGVDASKKMLEIAKRRCSNIKFILADMRYLDLDERFDLIIVWHSFFHLSPVDQRKMFPTFTDHLNNGGLLLFTSGPEAGEVWSNNGGENLYHSSLSTEEYQSLLHKHGFEVIIHKTEDPECRKATVWLAKLSG